jgi:MFS family permease
MGKMARDHSPRGGFESSTGLAPFRQPIFRALWTATLVSNLGTWMQNVGAAWLMTSLTPSPLVVSMVQTATTLPIFFLALPAGALADILPRRGLLVTSQVWMLVAAACLSFATFSHAISPVGLLAFTFAMGIGSAMNGPAWQAVVTDIVPKPDLTAAVSLNAASFNLARAVGPALGGIIVAKAGAGTTFLLNAVSFLSVIIVLYRWKPAQRKSVLPAERFVGAMHSGFRYLLYAPALKAVVVRTLAFTVFGSGIWALLPLVVKTELRRGPSAYGMLLGAMGLGAIAGTVFLPRLSGRTSVDRIVVGGTLVFAVVCFATACVPLYSVLLIVIPFGGLSWMVLLSSLSVATREVVPNWVQGRALSIYLLVFQGGAALGSLLWGGVAQRAGVRSALLCAALGLSATVILGIKFSLAAGKALKLTQESAWPEPVLASGSEPHSGPAFVTVEYRVQPGHSEEFIEEMHNLEVIRRRDGATQWGLFRDGSTTDLYLEEFVVESWLEHLRQHERMTVSDLEVQARIHAMHLGPEAPRVTHYVGTDQQKSRRA